MKYITLLLAIGFSAHVYAQESEDTYEPPCAHANLLGRWVGPEDEMNLDTECHGIVESTNTKFDYSNSDKLKIGDKKCKVFQKANEVAIECEGESDARMFHRYNEVVHK